MKLKSSSLQIRAAMAALVYNLLNILAWELPIAVRLGWRVNVVGDIVVIAISVLAIVMLAF